MEACTFIFKGVEEVEVVVVVVFYGKCSIGYLVVVFVIAAPYANISVVKEQGIRFIRKIKYINEKTNQRPKQLLHINVILLQSSFRHTRWAVHHQIKSVCALGKGNDITY